MGANSVSSSAKIIAAVLAVMLLPTTSVSQSSSGTSQSSTYGRDFFIGFMSSYPGANLSVTIGTPGRSTGFTVETSSWSYSGTVEYGFPVVVTLPPDLQITSSDYSDRQKAVHVFSQSHQQIFVLAKNFFRIGHATFLAYPHQPIEGLFMYEYVITSAHDYSGNYHSEFLLVGCEDNTVIHIVPSQNVTIPENVQVPYSATTDLEANITSNEFVLHRMQTFFVSNVDDLSGTRVVSNKALAVFSGHECPHEFWGYCGSCEPLVVQMTPTVTWGKKFLVLTDLFQKQFTAVQSTPVPVTTDHLTPHFTCANSNTSFENYNYHWWSYWWRSANNQRFRFYSNRLFCYFEFNEPTYLTFLPTGYIYQNDQAFTILSPLDQYVHEIEFVSLPINQFSSTNISITVPVEHFNPHSILLDDTPINCEWRAIYKANYTTHPRYYYYYIVNFYEVVGFGCTAIVSSGLTSPSQHRVAHSDENGVLSVIVYGFNDSPPRSYAYLAGQVLKTDAMNFTYIPFTNVSNFTNAIELPKDKADGNSGRIDIPDGLVFGKNVVTSAYVNENGIISFEDSFSNPYPETFPTDRVTSRSSLTVAPYWSDNDVRANGSIRYATYFSSCESSGGDTLTEGKRLMDPVNTYIQEQQTELEERFEGNWLLAAHWDRVHPSPHGENLANEDVQTLMHSDLELTNNYQAILITNAITTYAIFTYVCKEMQWSKSGNADAVIGYNAAGLYYYNHPLSGTSSVRRGIKCPRNNVTNMLFKLPVSQDIKVQRHIRCLQKYTYDKHMLCSVDINNLAARLKPCPCTLQQAVQDLGRYIKQMESDDRMCFVSSKPQMVDLPDGKRIQLTQQCCYKKYK